MSSPNPYINNFTVSVEQDLLDALTTEAIQVHGQYMYWLPRISVNEDQIYGEDTLSKFTAYHQIELYIKNIEGFEGEGDFISRFGLEIRDQITFTMSKSRFDDLDTGYPRPREGDLIFFPLNSKFFEIMHVEHESIFYQTGALPVYDIRCELFRYSSEDFDLVAAPTELATAVSQLEAISQVVTEDDHTSMPDTVTADNKTIEDEADSILDFDESNPFGSYGNE